MSLRNTRKRKDFWSTSVRLGCAMVIVGSFGALFTIGCESGGVGDPCVPEDEYKDSFAGFNLSEENIESRSFQCQTRICLVNHFQGRVTCPNGQGIPQNCNDPNVTCQSIVNQVTGEMVDTTCTPGGVILTSCDPTPCGEQGADPKDCNDPDLNGGNPTCAGNVCNSTGRFCECNSGSCPGDYRCCPLDTSGLPEGDPCLEAPGLCVTSVCAPTDRATQQATENGNTVDQAACYIPGTDEPVGVPVCGWCTERTPENSVYCSCRCGPPDSGASEADANFNFCDCPDGFTCAEVRPNVGLGDAQLAGKYCIKQGTEFTDVGTDCGSVTGFWASQCNGLPSSDGN
ncbi:MAG: hypothetical protein R3B72_14460 [Polyangiaceae bacterium]